MAEFHQAEVGSIASIITIGLNLAAALDTTIGTQRSAERELRELSGDISATTGILRQLQQLVGDDEQSKNSAQGQVTILKDAGIQEINHRAAQCEVLYRTIISNVTKAGMAGWKSNIKAEGIDTSVLKATSIWRGVRWAWLQPRFRRSLEELEVVKMNLLLILQVASLAKHQCCTIKRTPGMFEEEMAHRNLVDRLNKRRYSRVKKLAKKYHVSPPITANTFQDDLFHTDILDREEQELFKLLSSRFSWAQIRLKFNIQVSQRLTVRKLQVKSREIQKKIREQELKNIPGGINAIEDIKKGGPKDPEITQGKNSSGIEEFVVVSSGGSSKPPPYAESSAVQKDVPTVEKGKPVGEPLRGVDILGSGPPPLPPVEIKETASGPSDEVDVILDASHPIVKEKLKDVDIITMSAFKKQFGKVDSWFKELFGPSSLFFDDKESENLEAFMVLGDKKRLKVPFGHRRLKFGMKRVMKTKKTSTLDDFYALPKHLQVAINNVLLGAKVRDSRERVVICFNVLSLGDKVEDQHLLVFFSASGAPLEPVRFRDAVGRKFVVPFHLIQTWDEMKHMVNSAFLHVDVIGPQVRSGHYDLLHGDEIILPTCWEGLIKPGMSITMHMWPIVASNRPPAPRPWHGPGAPGCGPPQIHRPGNLFPPGPGPSPPPPPGMKPLGAAPGPGPRGWAGRPPPPRVFTLPIAMQRGSYCSYTTEYDTDSSFLGSCSDIENEEADLGLQLDYEEEKKKAKVEVKELLEKWTNALDVEAGPLNSSGFSSGSSGSSSESFVDD